MRTSAITFIRYGQSRKIGTIGCCLTPLDRLLLIWLSDLLTMSLPEEGYSRNALFALNYASTF